MRSRALPSRLVERLVDTYAGEVEFGLRALDPNDRHVVGHAYWQASRWLPDELLRMLPAPPLGVAP